MPAQTVQKDRDQLKQPAPPPQMDLFGGQDLLWKLNAMSVRFLQ
jgi:hypothetical protein